MLRIFLEPADAKAKTFIVTDVRRLVPQLPVPAFAHDDTAFIRRDECSFCCVVLCGVLCNPTRDDRMCIGCFCSGR